MLPLLKVKRQGKHIYPGRRRPHCTSLTAEDTSPIIISNAAMIGWPVIQIQVNRTSSGLHQHHTFLPLASPSLSFPWNSIVLITLAHDGKASSWFNHVPEAARRGYVAPSGTFALNLVSSPRPFSLIIFHLLSLLPNELNVPAWCYKRLLSHRIDISIFCLLVSWLRAGLL